MLATLDCAECGITRLLGSPSCGWINCGVGSIDNWVVYYGLSGLIQSPSRHLEDVCHRRLLVYGLAKHTILVNSQGGQDVKHRGVHGF